jgi:hypothetical protein
MWCWKRIENINWNDRVRNYEVTESQESGFGGIEVACWPLEPKVAGSNPDEAVGFFRARKSSARLPSEGQ